VSDFGEYWKSIARGRHFRIRAIAHGERQGAIAACQKLVTDRGGAILDFKLFSNLSMSLLVEAKGKELVTMLEGMREMGWSPESTPDAETIAAATTPLEGTIQLTFAGGDGALKQIIPAVPG